MEAEIIGAVVGVMLGTLVGTAFFLKFLERISRR
jgi:hypothetical protein